MNINETKMANPTVKNIDKVMKTASRVSNFSVASLLADTKYQDEKPKNSSLNNSEDIEPHKNTLNDHERKSSCSSLASDQEFDESINDEDIDCDSIVDVEDVRSDKSTNNCDALQTHSLTSKPLLRPMPFSAIAAAWGINGLSGWGPFRPPELFHNQNVGSK